MRQTIFISNKILVKKAGDAPKVPKVPDMGTPDDEGLYTAKHAFQGTTHHGKKSEFEPHKNVFEDLSGPVDSAPKDSKHVSSVKPNLGPHFDSMVKDLKQAGGNPLLVGGMVRDHVLGKESKDRDVEVGGISHDDLNNVLSKHGTPNLVGKQFGVTKLRANDGNDYDFSLPRRDSQQGVKHTDIQAVPDPTMTPYEASKRRDFTWNSLMQHPETGEIYDFHGGLKDLKDKKIRATDSKAFAEDALRPLRAMQFAGRMDMDMDPATAKLSSDMKTYDSLPPARIREEWEKLAEKGVKPSKGLKALQDMNWDRYYPELKLSPEKMKTVDAMATKLHSNPDFSGEDKNVLFFSALTHDMPKTEAESFLNRIAMTNTNKKRVLALKNGMDSPHVNNTRPDESTARNLSNHVAPESMDNLMHVLETTHGPQDHHKALHDTAKKLGVHQKPPVPLVNGDTLKEMGIKPGPGMGKALQNVYQAQLNGTVTTPDEAMAYIKNSMGDHLAALKFWPL